MLFQNEEASLKLEVWNYEFPLDSCGPDSEDWNWLVLRALYQETDGVTIRDTNSCLLAQELQEMTAGLKILNAGLKDRYQSEFMEPFFLLDAWTEEEAFRVEVSFALPNTMEDLDTAEISVRFSRAQLQDLIQELDQLCKKFPVRE